MMKKIHSWLAAASFIVLILCLWLWNRSHWVMDWITRETNRVEMKLVCNEGRMVWSRSTRLSVPASAEGNARWEWEKYTYDPHRAPYRPEVVTWQVAGFVTGHGLTGRNASRRVVLVGIPYWFPAILSAVTPLWALVRFRRRWLQIERMVLKECPRCGYSLIGNSSGVCPECGTRV
jgi:hypothetical protein